MTEPKDDKKDEQTRPLPDDASDAAGADTPPQQPPTPPEGGGTIEGGKGGE